MNRDFKTYLVRDSRLNDIQDYVNFSVDEGAANYTSQQYPSTSASSSSVQFSIQVPSESTCVDRHLLLQTQFNVNLSITNVAIGEAALVWGARDSLQQFPFNQLVQTVTVSINNTSVSTNQRDILSALLRCLKQEDLQKYEGMCPVYPDNYKSLNQAALASNNPMATYTNGSSYSRYLVPRGCHPVTVNFVSAQHANATPVGSIISSALTDVFVFNLQFTTVEPLFISPFVFGSEKHCDKAALLGINQLNIVFNLDSSLTHLLAYNGSGTCTASWNNVTAKPLCSMFMNYLTLQPNQLVPSKNVVPYMDYPRYITGTQNTSVIASGASGITILQNIQLNQIPDKFILFVRKTISTQTNKDSLTFWPITSVNFNFNNQSGLLSNCQVNDLYNISKANGLEQNWYEWSGVAQSYSGVNEAPGGVISSSVYTCGGPLIINPAKDLSLPAYLANGSIGQFSVQITVNYLNTESSAQAPEVVLICCNAGYLVTQSGQSSVYTGILNMEEVTSLKASSENKPLSAHDHRIIGGSRVHRHLMHHAKHHLRHLHHHIAGDLSAMGRSGGAHCGGGRSGGSKKSKLEMFS